MAYSYKGFISFGLVYIPIKLEMCIQASGISFNQLDKKTGSRVRYKKTCDNCDGRLLENKDIVKGYEYEDGKYVIFEDNDFEKLKTKREKNITIEQFVELDEIDPIFYEKPYYVVPTGAEKAYALLLNSMEKQNKVGIAKTVLGQKETVVALRVRRGEMLLNTLYFAEEIKKNPVNFTRQELSSKEQEMAELIIQNMTSPFDPYKYKDDYTEKVKNAIEAKIAGKEITAPKEREEKTIDLMEALKQSVASTSLSASKIKTVTKNVSKKSPQKKNAVAAKSK